MAHENRLAGRMAARLCAVLLGLSMCSLPTGSHAASQGVVGPSSTGSMQIVMSLGVQIIIRGLDDINLGTWTGTGNLVGTSSHCVGTNVAGGLFWVGARGSGADGAYLLSNGASTLAYEVHYNDGSGYVMMSKDTFLTNRQGVSGFAALLCALFGGTAERVQVRIPEANLTAAPAGTYSGVLTLTVGPE